MAKTDPLVSIVIPCYNAERWVAESIHSALDQSWPNKEVIVIDDGSKDNSVAVIKKFENRIRWETGPNAGGCAARNRGLALAKGEWIQFLDADDVLLPTCIEDKLAAIRQPDTVICSDVRMMGNAPEKGLPPYWSRKNYTIESMLREGTAQTAAPLHYRENLIAVGGFKTGLKCGQEFDLHLRLSALLGLTFVSNGKTGVLIRQTEGSVSRAAGSRMHVTHAEILFEFSRLLENQGLSSTLLRDIIAQRAAGLARKLWRMKKYDEARAIVKQSRILSSNWHINTYRNRGAALLVKAVGFENFEMLHSAWRALSGRKLDQTENKA